MATKSKKKKRDIYQDVTNRVIEALENDFIPWERPWNIGASMPRSVSTGKVYRGMNAFLLSLLPSTSPWWLTYNQAQKLGGQVKAGSKGTVVVFWRMIDKKDDGGAKTGDKIPFLACYSVFNLDQCEMPQEVLDRLDARLDRLMGNVDEKSDAVDIDAVNAAEQVCLDYVDRESIELSYEGGQAFYAPLRDKIVLPPKDEFHSPESYVYTFLHEAAHSTGHSKRLDRQLDKMLAPFGSEDYSFEELVAEMASAFCGATLGIDRPETDRNRDAYIKNWISKLKEDKKLLISAAGKSAKAADMVLGMQDEGEAEEELVYEKSIQAV